MKAIDRFTLEKHDGPYEQWPLRSRLSLDGKLTGISLPGYELLHQFEIPSGYILVTDYDCPHEEFTHFALISKELRLQSCRWLGWMYDTFLLERIEWRDDRSFTAFFCGNFCFRLTVRSWGIPYLRPRLKLQFDRPRVPADDGVEQELGTLNIRKPANGFIPEAVPARRVPVTALSAIHRFRRRQGGLWVGGTVFVSNRGVSFVPNGVNRFVHSNLEPVNVQAHDIREVRCEFGWLTGIVVVKRAQDEFRFRCYGAKQLAATMCANFHVGPVAPAA